MQSFGLVKLLRYGFIGACLILFSAMSMADGRGLPDFTELVKKNSSAVVNISTTQKHSPINKHFKHQPGTPGTPFDDFLNRFFGGEPPDMDGFNAESLGSGFIISKEGYVLTNNHVIKGADEILVRLNDKREFVAEVIGTDARSDVALLKIPTDHLPVVTIGSAQDLQVGSWVLAIGSPFGFDYSATAGIVSAKGRSLPNETYVPFIQTDVAINPGNSGGPLFNLEGEVVGINAQIFSQTGGFMGLSFAIPIDVAMNVVEQLKSSGHVKRGWLGVLIQDVTRELAASFDMDKPIGALVAKVLPGSPSEDAKIKVGDVVVKFNHKMVESSSALPPMVGQTTVGDRVPVEVIRLGKKKTIMVVIGELPEEDELVAGRADHDVREVLIKRLAMTVSDLRPDQFQTLEEKVAGVIVDATEEGLAARSGIRKGDIIMMYDNIAIENAMHFKKLVADTKTGRTIPILIQRRSGPVFIAIKMTEDD